jgi:hypothetical protein
MTTRASTITSMLVALGLLAEPLQAQDKSPLDDPYVALKVTLGISGSMDAKTDSVTVAGVTVNSSNGVTVKNDLELSYGLAAQYMLPLHHYFTLGGLLGVMSWQSNAGNSANADRNLGLDIAVVPQGRLPVTRTVELYLALPLGLTLDYWNAVESSASVGGIAMASRNADPALGLCVSLLVGVRALVSDGFGLFTEFGYTHRRFTHRVNLSTSVGGVALSSSVDSHLSLGQVAWNLGVFF